MEEAWAELPSKDALQPVGLLELQVSSFWELSPMLEWASGDAVVLSQFFFFSYLFIF